MGEFDVKYAAYERAMQRDNYWGLKGEAIGEQLGRQSDALQRAEKKAENKKIGREFAKQLAIEKRNLALTEGLGGQNVSQPIDVVKVTQPETVKPAEPKTIKIAEKIACGGKGKQPAYFLISADGKVYEVTHKTYYNNASRNKTISLEGLKEVDTTKRKLPKRVQTSLDKITDKLKNKEKISANQKANKYIEKVKETFSKPTKYSPEILDNYSGHGPNPQLAAMNEDYRKIQNEQLKDKIRETFSKPTKFSPEILDNYSGHGPNQQLDAMNAYYRNLEQQGKQKVNKHNKFVFNTTVNVNIADKKVLANIEQNINETNTHVKELKQNITSLETKVHNNNIKINSKIEGISHDLGALTDIVNNQGRQLSHLTELVEKQSSQIETMSKNMGKMNKKLALVAGVAALAGGVIGNWIGGSKKETIVKQVAPSNPSPFIPWIQPKDSVKTDSVAVKTDSAIVKQTPADSTTVKQTPTDTIAVQHDNAVAVTSQANPAATSKVAAETKQTANQSNQPAADTTVVQVADSIVARAIPADTTKATVASIAEPKALQGPIYVKPQVVETDTLLIKKYGKRALKRLQKKFEKYPDKFKEVPTNKSDYKMYIEECQLIRQEEIEQNSYVA